MKTKAIILISVLLAISLITCHFAKKFNLNSKYEIGQAVDSLNGVIVYYNGGVDHSAGRNVSADNYNIGQKYQCVEFVKRYYYQHLNHKMPDAFGHAKDFYEQDVADGQVNEKRALLQFSNGSSVKPEPDDLLIFSGSLFNRYGHVAIISLVSNTAVEIIQQNPGPFGKSREVFPLQNKGNKWYIDNDKVLGWLRKRK